MARLLPWTIMLVGVPSFALAHAAERGFILLLPTGYYLIGGALAVAASFVALLAAPRGRLGQIARPGRPVRCPAGSWIGFGLFWALIAIGFAGARDPLANPLPLVVWTLWWIGFTVLVAVFGDLWRLINPWSGPVALVRSLSGTPPWRLPVRVGYWPAILAFGLVAWFEIVSLAPDDPARLARAAGLYWLLQFAAMVAFGAPRWQYRGEAFSVLFRLLSRLSPVRRGAIRWPGTGLSGATLGRAGWLFVIAAIAGVTFDGLSGTFWWLGLIGVNPLEFPGRSAVMTENTVGLVGAWALMSGSFAATVWLGNRLVGGQVELSRALGRLALSLLPIALAYHLAHYLVILLINGQYAIVALSDPLGIGADWFGTANLPVRTGFLADMGSVEAIWQAQVGIIVAGHVLAVLMAHGIAGQLWPGRGATMISQVPLAVLMVGYTVLGLWLLSTPTGV